MVWSKHAKSSDKHGRYKPLPPRTKCQDLQKLGCNYVKAMKRPEGTVSTKTEVSCKVQEYNRLKNITHTMQIGEEYHVNLNTLLKSLVANLHILPHCKHDTFSVLDYARGFGTIMKESLKRLCSSGAKILCKSQKLLPYAWNQHRSWHLLTLVIKDYTSVFYTNHQCFSFCTETADSCDYLQECD